MTRQQVFYAISTERDFQDKLVADESRPDMISDLHIGDTLAAIQVNINKALSAWYIGSVPHRETLEYLRKIAALCVQAGEKYEMPVRH